MKRILIAGVLGGVVVFLWGAISHMLLPLGEMGIKNLPAEAAILPTLQREIQQPGFYFFPGMDMSRQPTAEEQQAWEARYKAGPIGILVYHPTGWTPLSPRQLLAELASNILAAFILAWVLSLAGITWSKGIAIAALFGVFAWLSISVSHWNWYGFPTSFLFGEALDQVLGWTMGGVVIAALLRRKPPVVE